MVKVPLKVSRDIISFTLLNLTSFFYSISKLTGALRQARSFLPKTRSRQVFASHPASKETFSCTLHPLQRRNYFLSIVTMAIFRSTCTICNAPGAKRCSTCHSTFYCNPVCQKKDWSLHKTLCKDYKDMFSTRPSPSHKL